MATRKATLTLKAGGTEVRYEAEREAVEAQLELIVGRLLRAEPADVQVGLTDDPPEVAKPPASSAPASAESPAALPEAASEARRLARLYRIGNGGRLRLRKLAGRTADTLLLVLYGMLKLQNRSWVHAPGMTSVARASGARFERADRLLAGYQDLIEGFGNRRAKRYRLTAAGCEHCASLVESLIGPISGDAPTDDELRTIAAAEGSLAKTGIPDKVTSRWKGELLSASQAAERLGVDEAEIGKLRHRWELLGLPGGTRKRRRYFYPAFQIDANRREIYPPAREANLLVSRAQTSWGIADWWSSEEPELGKRPMDLIGTPDAAAAVCAARAKFGRAV